MFEELKHKYMVAKENLTKARYIFNYFLVPSYVAFLILGLLLITIFLLVDPKLLVIGCIVIFALIVLALIGVLSYLPFVKKEELKVEVQNLKDFFNQEVLVNPETTYILPRSGTNGVVDLVFLEKGMKIGGLDYTYSGFQCGLYTSNYLNKVSLIAVFERTDIGDNEDLEEEGVVEFSLMFDLNLMSVFKKYNIKFVNEDVFNFIKTNPEEAVKQIMKFGRIQNDYYKTK